MVSVSVRGGVCVKISSIYYSQKHSSLLIRSFDVKTVVSFLKDQKIYHFEP